ncbi:hypothetical protein [Vibrio algivorus]|uniref:MarR family transcriptional regulator n=1 Tax=Vibrio algivorus TaxID=1667024 RepID=A0A557PGW3_9VIBR|nr:hypothetical protein [Vibrio algivorus]TVO39894.1 hypothetical protein FOF44_00035 [Vibrio algivorus]
MMEQIPLSYQACQKRGNQREVAVLDFLAQDTFTDFKTLNHILQIEKKGNISRFLTRMVNKGLLIKHEVPFVSSKIALWGITLD